MDYYQSRSGQVFSTIMKKIYSRGGYAPLAEMADFLKLDQKPALNFFQDYPTHFKICYEKDPTSDDEKPLVLGVTNVTFCAKHASKPGSCFDCDGLHVCKFYSLGTNCKFGDFCSFGHSFKDSVHNERILRKHHLLQLDELELKCLFQKIENRCEVTTPNICKYFNRGSCEKSDCICLHICRYYLMNECRYGKKCKISHNFNRNDCKILKTYGIVTSSISDALAKLRILYQVEEHNKTNNVKTPEFICLHYLSSNGCGFGDKCRHHHKEMPYQWCYRNFLSEDDDDDVNEWHDFNPSWNEEIEKKFCNLEDETHISDKKKSSAKFQFGNMTCLIAKQQYTLQRLSTPSYKTDIKSPLTTTWIWYWKGNDDIWIEYGSSTGKSIDVTNEDIEKMYLESPTGMMIITRKAKQKKIRIDFQEMIQNGKRTREIIRRPRFISSEEAQTLRKQTLETSKNMKDTNWEVQDLSSHFNISMVDEKSKEYKSVSEEFHDSMKEYAIIKIERIKNGNLWETYKWKKTKMLKEVSKPEEINEKYLFHGTDFESIEAICKQGFDVRLSGTAVGSKYGKGIYFSEDSAFAHNYTIASDGEHKLLFANVLIGEFIKGKLDYVRPPPKNSAEKGGKLYDSCVDDVSDPKLFVIFANEQTYPAYVITYRSTN